MQKQLTLFDIGESAITYRKIYSEFGELVNLHNLLPNKKPVFGDKDFVRYYELRDKYSKNPQRLTWLLSHFLYEYTINTFNSGIFTDEEYQFKLTSNRRRIRTLASSLGVELD